MDAEMVVKTNDWTTLIRENAYMTKALEHLATIYHRAIDDNQTAVPIRDITDVLEISEINKEVEII